MLDGLMLFLPDLHLFILHYYTESSTPSDGVYSNASIGLWRDGYTSNTFLSYLELCYKLNSHKFFKRFYIMILIGFTDGAFCGVNVFWISHIQATSSKTLYG